MQNRPKRQRKANKNDSVDYNQLLSQFRYNQEKTIASLELENFSPSQKGRIRTTFTRRLNESKKNNYASFLEVNFETQKITSKKILVGIQFKLKPNQQFPAGLSMKDCISNLSKPPTGYKWSTFKSKWDDEKKFLSLIHPVFDDQKSGKKAATALNRKIRLHPVYGTKKHPSAIIKVSCEGIVIFCHGENTFEGKNLKVCMDEILQASHNSKKDISKCTFSIRKNVTEADVGLGEYPTVRDAAQVLGHRAIKKSEEPGKEYLAAIYFSTNFNDFNQDKAYACLREGYNLPDKKTLADCLLELGLQQIVPALNKKAEVMKNSDGVEMLAQSAEKTVSENSLAGEKESSVRYRIETDTETETETEEEFILLSDDEDKTTTSGNESAISISEELSNNEEMPFERRLGSSSIAMEYSSEPEESQNKKRKAPQEKNKSNKKSKETKVLEEESSQITFSMMSNAEVLTAIIYLGDLSSEELRVRLNKERKCKVKEGKDYLNNLSFVYLGDKVVVCVLPSYPLPSDITLSDCLKDLGLKEQAPLVAANEIIASETEKMVMEDAEEEESYQGKEGNYQTGYLRLGGIFTPSYEDETMALTVLSSLKTPEKPRFN